MPTCEGEKFQRLNFPDPYGFGDILVETEEGFAQGVADGWSLPYRKIYEGGYKIYDRNSGKADACGESI